MRAFSLLLSGVYPRMSGGTERSGCGRVDRQGLSPHERGNHIHRHEAEANRGSIPA